MRNVADPVGNITKKSQHSLRGTPFQHALVLLAAISLMEGLPLAIGQASTIANPLAGNAAAIQEGASLFRGNCSPCHGLGGHGGGRGPDLTSGRWVHGSSDAAIFRTITHGVPGTEMPANSFEDSETWAIIAYLRSLSPSHMQPIKGNLVEGKRLFYEKLACSRCHMVDGQGGRLGPDLSRVGAARSAQYLETSIRDPNKDLSDGLSDPNNHYGEPLSYDTVTVVTSSGQRITGIARNEDTFSLQFEDMDQKLHLFLKKDLKEVIHERKSLMPAYPSELLSDGELSDLLVFLQSLRGREMR